MRRRDFVRVTGVGAAALAGGSAVWPNYSLAQRLGRVRRIGVLMAYPESNQEGQALISALPQALRKLGWTDGANLRIEVRWGALDDGAALSRSAKELLALEPEVIVTQNTPATAAMRQQTTVVPNAIGYFGRNSGNSCPHFFFASSRAPDAMQRLRT